MKLSKLFKRSKGLPKGAILTNKDKDIFKHLGALVNSNVTLKGTDNDYWIVYNRYNKTTYVVCNSTMEIYFEVKGKVPNIEFD